MKVESITIHGFRCFDEAGETIRLDDLTCFVGPNASGKTAAMMALARMFGEFGTQRQVVAGDFDLGAGEALKSKSPRTLFIECRLVFPELEHKDGEKTAAVPETFNQMIVDGPGDTPYCRIRLDATWTNDGTPAGDVEQSSSWIVTNSDDLKIIEDGNRRRVQSGDRGKIRVVYVPAARDPDQQIRVTTATSYGRLLNALAWDGAEESLKKRLIALESQLAKLPGVRAINTQVASAGRSIAANGEVTNNGFSRVHT